MHEQKRPEVLVQELQRTLKLARERLSDLAWELEDLEIRLEPLQAQLERGEARQAPGSEELEQLRHHRSRHEELVLQQMMEIDRIEAHIAELRAAQQAHRDQQGDAA